MVKRIFDNWKFIRVLKSQNFSSTFNKDEEIETNTFRLNAFVCLRDICCCWQCSMQRNIVWRKFKEIIHYYDQTFNVSTRHCVVHFHETMFVRALAPQIHISIASKAKEKRLIK